jgi:predicted PurR-regulated permease PerM
VIARTNTKLERFVFVFAGAMLLLGFMYWAQAVLLPVLTAVYLTFILSPIVLFLQRLGLPRVFSVILVAFLLSVAIGCFFQFFFYQFKGLATDLPRYRVQIKEKLDSVRETTSGSWISDAMEFFTDLSSNPDPLQSPSATEPITVKMDHAPLAAFQSIAGTTLHSLVNASLVFVLLLFMLIQREDLRNRLIRLGGHRHATSTTKVFDDASQRIRAYLVTQVLVNSGVGVVLGCGFFLIGVPYALIWGFLAFVFRYIPYLGAALAAFFPLVVSWAVLPGWTPFFLVLGLIAVVEIVTVNVIEPILFGHSIGVTGLALLVTTVFWTWLWGPLGLVLSTPLTAYLVVLGRHVPALEFVTQLMGEDDSPHPQLAYFQRLLAKDSKEAGELLEEHLNKNGIDQVYDEVLLPAMSLTLREKGRGILTEDDVQYFLGRTRAILQDLVWEPSKKPAEGNAAAIIPPGPAILGISCHEEEDSLLLRMFRESSVADKSRMTLYPQSDETLLARIESEKPLLVFVTAWASEELLPARRLCKQLRARGFAGKILVCCWGEERDADSIRSKLIAAGADAVGTNFSETQILLHSLVV